MKKKDKKFVRIITIAFISGFLLFCYQLAYGAGVGTPICPLKTEDFIEWRDKDFDGQCVTDTKGFHHCNLFNTDPKARVQKAFVIFTPLGDKCLVYRYYDRAVKHPTRKENCSYAYK
jgi:hypothetical protein